MSRFINLPTTSLIIFVGADRFELPIHADYVIYSHAPNQLEHYSHLIVSPISHNLL